MSISSLWLPRKFYVLLLLSMLFIQCSDQPAPESSNSSNAEKEKLSSVQHITILDEIPDHIKEVENLTIYPGDSEPTHEIELVPEQNFGDTDESLLHTVINVAVDHKERVLILNSDQTYKPALYVYNPDGSYHSQIGRDGRGPGEYGTVLGLQFDEENLVMFDHTGQRLNVYNKEDYTFERQTLLDRWPINKHESVKDMKSCCYRVRSDGNILTLFYNQGQDSGRVKNTYLLADINGNELKYEPLTFPAGLKVGIRPDGQLQPMQAVQFMGQTLVDMSTNGELYSVFTRDFLVKKYDANGIYQSAFYYPLEGPAFDLKWYTENNLFSPRVHHIERGFKAMGLQLPKTSPIVNRFIMDDQKRMWIAVPAGPNRENYEWRVHSESGEYIASLLLPRHQPIFDIKNGYLYSRNEHEETGTEFVTKYRIDLKQK